MGNKYRPLIIYHAHDIGHVRCFESIPEKRKDLRQIIIGPAPKFSNGVTIGYDDCNITNVVMCNNDSLTNKMVIVLDPDVYVVSKFIRLKELSSKKKGFALPGKCKKVLIHHGLFNSVTPTAKRNINDILKFDLFCGQGDSFRKFLIDVGVDENRIIHDALPQLDLFHSNENFSRYKYKILSSISNYRDEKIILYAGYGGHDGRDYVGHNKEYFDILFEIDRLSEKHGFIVLFKSRRHVSNVISYFNNNCGILGGKKETQKYLSRFREILDKPNIITFDKQFPLKYLMFADVVVINGYSTIEVETSLSNTPLINVCWVNNSTVNGTFASVQSGAAVGVTDKKDFESAIIRSMYDDEFIENIIKKQNAYTAGLGINSDGLAGKRACDAIIKLSKKKK